MNDGLLALRFRTDKYGRTRLVERRQRYPMTTTGVLPFESESGALIYTQNAAGSVFGGDRLHTDLHLEDDASVCISTPSATRIQGNGLAAQTTHIKLGRGAFIESIPDMIIAHPKAVYRQETHIDLAEGAEAILGESIAPGRVARGEEYVYDAVSLRLEASFNGQLVLVDASTFRPGEASPALIGALGQAGYIGSLVILSQKNDQEELATKISARLEELKMVYGGAAALASGCGAIVRFLADDAPALRNAMQSVWAIARHHVRGRPAPTLRK